VSRVRARIDRAQRDLTDAEHRLRETVHLRAIVTQLAGFAARVRAGLDELSWLDRRTIIRTLVAKIEMDEAAATVAYRLPSAEHTTPPSGASPAPESAPESGNSKKCLLRSQRVGFVTSRGPHWQAVNRGILLRNEAFGYPCDRKLVRAGLRWGH
jgi:hypothetical protein